MSVGVTREIDEGSPSLDIVSDSKAANAVIDMVRYSNRLSDPVLSEAVRSARLAYHLAFALGTNLNVPYEQRSSDLIERQLKAGRESLDAIERATRRLDEIEKRL